MKKSMFTESQIVAILKEEEGGIAVTEILLSHGIGAATFYKWRSKYGALKRLRSSGSKSLSSNSPTTSRKIYFRSVYF